MNVLFFCDEMLFVNMLCCGEDVGIFILRNMDLVYDLLYVEIEEIDC